jgi:2-keto-4-pentenoate hydratase/2-oxohepta-3-ene-1,7-dioic acid hydratase in catechol pathway
MKIIRYLDDASLSHSGSMAIVPGTVIHTGTCTGVGMVAKTWTRWLRPGDSMSIEIEKIGRLANSSALYAV